MMGNWKKSGLVGVGVAAGLLLGLNFSAIAQREARNLLASTSAKPSAIAVTNSEERA